MAAHKRTLSQSSDDDRPTLNFYHSSEGEGDAISPPIKKFKSNAPPRYGSFAPPQVAFISGGITKPAVPGYTPSSLSDSTEDSEDADGHVDHGAHSMGQTERLSESDGDDSEEDDLTIDTTTHKASEAPRQDAGGMSVAEKLMAKMGYQKGKGLGKDQQGRVNIVEASKQRGRRGLGMHLQAFEPSDIQWDSEKERVTAEETVDWLPPCEQPIPSLDEMTSWMVLGEKKLRIEDETEYVHPKVLLEVLKSKSVFDQLESEEMRRARTKSNPFETIRGVFFQNRAAMKMANMDCMLDFMFTTPKDPNGKSSVDPNDLLYFADVCAGPGGFSEYVLWRRKGECKGFGFTLKGPCDFKLENFFAAPAEFFEPHYGKDGIHGDGDIFREHNLDAFRKFVIENTDGKGVHFVMADGGFSVEGQENIQEILSKQLYLCQFMCALSILREGGHFVCKLFDIFTPYSVGLVYLMYRAFREVSIIKPVTSRPANSERYIVCKWKKPGADSIHDYMYRINSTLNKFGVTSNRDVTHVVPLDMIKADEEFFNYIVESNYSIGTQQIIGLQKIQAYAQNTDLYERRQALIREECLKLWKVPDKVRTAPTKADPSSKFFELTKEDESEIVGIDIEELNYAKLDGIKSLFDYRCMVSSGQRHIIYSSGRSHIFKWSTQFNVWKKLEEVKLELPAETILEAELVMEYQGEGRAQRRMMGIHIIDAICLAGKDISKLHFNDRAQRISKFVRAITKNSRPDLAHIRIKEVFRFEEIDHVFTKLSMRRMKGGGMMEKVCYCNDQKWAVIPLGIYFIKTVKDPWSMAWSRGKKQKYFYNVLTQVSQFQIPLDSIADYKSCLKKRLLWKWEEGVKVHNSQTKQDEDKLSRDNVINFVHQKLPM